MNNAYFRQLINSRWKAGDTKLLKNPLYIVPGIAVHTRFTLYNNKDNNYKTIIIIFLHQPQNAFLKKV